MADTSARHSDCSTRSFVTRYGVTVGAVALAALAKLSATEKMLRCDRVITAASARLNAAAVRRMVGPN